METCKNVLILKVPETSKCPLTSRIWKVKSVLKRIKLCLWEKNWREPDSATPHCWTITLTCKLRSIHWITTSESSLIKMKSWLKNLISLFKLTRPSDKDLIAKPEFRKSDRGTTNKLHTLITTWNKANHHWDLRDLHFHLMLSSEITYEFIFTLTNIIVKIKMARFKKNKTGDSLSHHC